MASIPTGGTTINRVKHTLFCSGICEISHPQRFFDFPLNVGFASFPSIYAVACSIVYPRFIYEYPNP